MLITANGLFRFIRRQSVWQSQRTVFCQENINYFILIKSCKRVFISGNATCRCSENKGLIKNLFHSINTVIHISPKWPRDWPWRQIFHSSLHSRLRDVHAKMSLKPLFYAKLQFNYTYPIAESVEVQKWIKIHECCITLGYSVHQRWKRD